MRKSKEQVQKERQEREEIRQRLKAEEYGERLGLELKQKQERAALKKKQKQRRKDNATTGAGGCREGAGRPLSLPHKPWIENGVDFNPRKTMTFYGSQDEKEPVKKFLKVWRELRFKVPPEQVYAYLPKFNALTMYQLMTGGTITDEREIKRLRKLLPTVAELARQDDD